MLSSTQRFSSRVENYVKYRPSYPVQVLETLRTECGLSSHDVLADIGSGTGILTALLLEHGNTVYAVEPNLEMRSAAEASLGHNSNFHSVNGTAEATTLADRSVRFVLAGQAFHWFEPAVTRREFVRILQPGGWVALIWNRRASEETPFQNAYESLLHSTSTEYAQVSHERIDSQALTQFFAPNSYSTRSFPNFQQFDKEGLHGRVLSSSYAPLPDQPGHEGLMTGLDELFAIYNEDGLIRFDYETQIIFGQLS